MRCVRSLTLARWYFIDSFYGSSTSLSLSCTSEQKVLDKLSSSARMTTFNSPFSFLHERDQS
jgi:hypothetical protein